MQPSEGIRISEERTDLAQEIDAALTRTLRQSQPQAINGSFVLAARKSDRTLVGGLTGTTSYGWLLVKTLWVSEEQRGSGIGRQLMQRAEEKARHVGCHGAWLDTSSPQAMAFYRRLGYEIFGQLENGADQHPAGHRRWFLRKAL